MDARAALTNLAAWRATSEADRVSVLVELATALGAGWRAGRTSVGRHGLGELLRRDLGLAFVVVPGGWLRMGFSADDLLAAAHAREELPPRPVWGGAIVAARPTRWVRMRPYLLATTGLLAQPGGPTTDGGRATEAYKAAVDATLDPDRPGPSAEELVKAYEGGPPDEGAAEPGMQTFAADAIADAIPEGFRLPSEAELEWALREGGTTRWIGVPGEVEVSAANRRETLLGTPDNGFGLVGLRDLQNPCADGAVDYDVDSPIDQRACATDRETRIARWAHTYWQDDDGELIGVHAAMRAAPDEYGETILRVAHDLPGLTDGTDEDGDADASPPGPLAEHARVIAALTGDETRRRDEAITALAHLAVGPGHDTAETAAAVIEALPRIAPAARAHALVWLADVQVGGHYPLTIERPERKRRHELGEDRAATRAAVAAATGPIVDQLDDADPDVRAGAALALAFTVDAPAEAKAALGKRLARESEPGVQAMLILACVRLGTGFRPPAPEPVIAAAIAIATAFDGPPNVEALIAATALGPTPHLPFGRGNLGNVAIGLLRTMSPEVQAEAAVAIAARAAAERDRGLVLVACEMAFGKPTRGAAPRLLDELSSSQRQVTSRLADVDVSIDWLGFGLPPTVTARRRFLALDADGPTDRFVAFGPDREVPLWYALRHALATEGAAAAQAELGRVLARLPLAERVAIFLDRHAHQLDSIFDGVTLAGLLAESKDPGALRAAVDELVAAPSSGPRGAELVRAVAATRPGEELPEALLAELDGWQIGADVEALRGFRPAAVARHLNAIIQPALDRALASNGWQSGLHLQLEQWATVLAVAPSPMATRRLLLLGWASGQPAAVREAVGEAARGQATLTPILAEYDALPQFTSWPVARAAMSAFVE